METCQDISARAKLVMDTPTGNTGWTSSSVVILKVGQMTERLKLDESKITRRLSELNFETKKGGTRNRSEVVNSTAPVFRRSCEKLPQLGGFLPTELFWREEAADTILQGNLFERTLKAQTPPDQQWAKSGKSPLTFLS